MADERIRGHVPGFLRAALIDPARYEGSAVRPDALTGPIEHGYITWPSSRDPRRVTLDGEWTASELRQIADYIDFAGD